MTLPIFNPENPFEVLDFTGAINELDTIPGLVTGMNTFDITSTSLHVVDFDKQESTNHVLTQVSPFSGEGQMIGDRDVTNYSMALRNYKEFGAVTAQDIQNKRRVGGTDMTSFGEVTAIKTQDMRHNADLTIEYLQFLALKGEIPTGAAGSSTNMYDFFGLTQSDYTLDLETGDASTNLNNKFEQLKRTINTNFKGGRAAGAIDIIVDYDLWDEMMENADFQTAYTYFQSTVNPQRDDLTSYYDWGVTEYFEHAGVRIFAYNPTFNLAGGSTTTVLDSGTGIALPRNRAGMYKGYHGVSTKVDQANGAVSPMYAYAWMDQSRDRYNLELQFSHLYACMKPQAVIQLS